MERTNQSAPTVETYGGLQLAYDHFNRHLFESRLPGALITLQREHKTFGYYSAERFGTVLRQRADEIAMNPVYFGLRPIKATLSTLAHEMVHQWQQLFGKPGRGRYHNREWAEAMEAIGLMPSDTGQPGGKKVGDRVSHYIIDGGRFDVSCDLLLTTDFELSWFDRFPPPELRKILGGADDEEGDGDDDEETAVKKKRKVKYSCPNCQANVWGKPGLSIFCGKDATPFEPVI